MMALWMGTAGAAFAQDARPPTVQTALPTERLPAGPSVVIPAPAPPPFRSLVLAPPLSVSDAIRRRGEVADCLEVSAENAPPQSLATVASHLTSVTRYIRKLDDAHPTLPYYRWKLIARRNVERPQRDTFELERPILGISAIALRAHRADIRVDQLRVIGKSGLVVEFNQERTIRNSLRRREVYFLDADIDITRIEVAYKSLAKPGRTQPRFKLEAGISSVPEYGKQTIHRLSLARMEIEEEHFPAAVVHVRTAIEKLAAFNRTRRP